MAAGNRPGGGAIVRLDLPGALQIPAEPAAGSPGAGDGERPGATGSAR
jgi:hypothetical protein